MVFIVLPRTRNPPLRPQITRESRNVKLTGYLFKRNNVIFVFHPEGQD